MEGCVDLSVGYMLQTVTHQSSNQPYLKSNLQTLDCKSNALPLNFQAKFNCVEHVQTVIGFCVSYQSLHFVSRRYF